MEPKSPSPSRGQPSRKLSPTPYLTERQATYKFSLPLPSIAVPDAKDMKGERRDLGLDPDPIPKNVKDRFYASVMNADVRSLFEILRDWDCRELVDEKEVHATGTDGWRVRDFTPCHYACQRGLTEVLKILIAKGGANANICADFGVTPIMVATEEGNLECIKVLLELTTINVNFGDIFGKTAFWLAANHGHVDIMELLLSHECLVNVRDNHGISAVHAAARSDDNEDALQLICSIEGIDVNRPDNYGRTPLDYAPASSNNVVILENAGAKSTAEEVHSEEIRRACMHNDNESLSHILANFECRGIIDKQEPGFDGWRMRGYTAMQYAAIAGNAQAISLLLKHGADADGAGDDEGNAALLIACSKGKAQVVLEMLRGPHASRVNIHVVNRAGQGAVFAAVNCNQRECLKLLLSEEKMDFNRADSAEQVTPLHLACKNSFEACAKLLLDAGALPNLRDNNGHTCSSYASQDSLKRLLRKYGGL